MKGKKIVSTLLALLLLASLPVSALAAEWDIGKGDITVNAESGGQTVRQGGGAAVPDSAPVITGTSKENNVTINADSGQTASVTLSGVNIDVRDKGKAAVSTTGEGNVSIELDGDNTLKSATNHAGLEKNNGGSLTIADENKNGKLTAKGGDYGAGIGGGCYGYGNNITVSGDAKLKVQGGVEDNIDGAGAGIGNGGSSDERAIPVTGAEVEPDTSGLTTNGSIEYYAPGADMEKDKPEKTTVGTLPPQEKPIERGADAPLYRVTDRDGRDIACTAEQKGGVLTVTVDADFAVLTSSLNGMTALRAQGVEKIVFVTKGATSAFMLSDLLEKGESGDSYNLTHDGKAVTFTLGEKMTDVSAILTKP